jgi:hypothetical protein
LRGLRKFSDVSFGFGFSLAKTQSSEILFSFLCVFAPLREMIPDLVVALPREVLCGEESGSDGLNVAVT